MKLTDHIDKIHCMAISPNKKYIVVSEKFYEEEKDHMINQK